MGDTISTQMGFVDFMVSQSQTSHSALFSAGFGIVLHFMFSWLARMGSHECIHHCDSTDRHS